MNWSSLHLWRNSWPKIEQQRWAHDFASGHLTWSNEIRSLSYRRVCQYAVFWVAVHLMLLAPRKPQNSMLFMLAQRRLCVCLFAWSTASLNSQSEQGKFVGLRCTRKMESVILEVLECYLLMPMCSKDVGTEKTFTAAVTFLFLVLTLQLMRKHALE